MICDLLNHTFTTAFACFRIVVDQAVVTLVGVVRSGVESNILESITRQSFETREVVNLLQYPQ